MAASQEQKVDFLLKKIGYVQSKTGIAEDASGISGTKKAPTEENKPSPLVTPSTSVWADSTFIPTSPPTSNTTYVGIYTATNAFQLTHDNTVIGNRTFIARSTFGNQSASISGDWIDPSFGADYAVQVYKGDPDYGGVSLSPTGSGNSDEWFFDYSSGILNFNGTNVPSGITTSNVYLIGYKYLGAKGILPPAGRANFTSLNVTGLSTFASAVDINADLDVDGRTELDITNISETLNVTGISTFASAVDINADLDVDGRTELDITNISETLNVTGISTFASDIDINASIDVDGHTELDDVNVSTALTANNLIVTGSTLLSHSNSLKLQTTGIGISVSNGIGLTATIAGPTNLIIDPGVVGDNTGIVRIKGDLFVDGEQTQINSTTIELADFIVGVATTATSDLLTDGAGIQIGPNNTFLYEFNSGTNPSLKSSENLNVASGKVYQIDQTERLSADTLSLGTGTTIHSPASNALTFGTNGTEKVRITSDGDVGIGSVIPAGKLDVVGHTELDSVNVSGLSTFASNVDINSDLDVDGRTELDTTNISETLNVTGIATFASDIDINASIDVDGRTELDITNISETLNVTGISTFASAVDINADLDVDGRTELDTTNISETLNVTGIATFASDIDINASIDVDGHTELDNLNVSGVSTFASDIDINASIDVDGHTELDDLKVTGISTFASAVDINADLDVDGRTELDITNISETLNVTGITTFGNNVNVGGALSVTGNSYFVGMVTFAAGTDGNIVLGDAATDNVVFNADVNSNIIPNTNNAYDLGSSSQEWKDLYLNGIAYIDTLQVHEGSTLNGDLDVDGHTELDNLNVSGVSTFASAVDINADLDVDGRTELDITNISETLNVTGIATFANNIDANGNLDVDGHTNLDNVSVAGVSTFSDDVNIIDDKKINLGIASDLQIYHDGTSSYIDNNTSHVYIRNNVDNDDGGNIYIQAKSGENSIVCNDDGNVQLYYDNYNALQTNANGVKVQGPSGGSAILYLNADQGSDNADKFRFKVENGGPLSIENNASGSWEKSIEITGNGAVSLYYDNVSRLQTTNTGINVVGHSELDNVNISGVSTFASAVDINADLDVDGHTETDTLRVSGLSTFTDNIDANGNLDVDGHTELDDVNVSGASTFTGHIDANGNLDVDGQTDLDVLNVSDTATFTGNVDIDGHTELDNVNIAGFSTFSQLVDVNANLTVNQDLTIEGSVGIASLIPSAKLDVVGLTKLDDVNVSGASTFTGHIDANGNLDVDGQTDLDDLKVTGVSTFSNHIDANSDLDVDGHTELDNLNVSGVSTFASAVDINADLDVDGHTELDNVNISGVATATAFHTGVEGSAIRVTSDTISGPSEIIIDPAGVGNNTGALRIKGDLFVDGTQTQINSTTIELADFIVGIATTATSDLLADGAGIQIGPNNTLLYDNTNTSLKSSENLNLASGKKYKINGTDVLSVNTLESNVVNSSLTNLGTLTELTVTGAIDANGDLDVDGHTELDNLKVTGVSTFSSNLNLSGNITSNVTIVSTDAGSSAGPEFKLWRNSASPADADYLGQIKFAGESDTGVERNYAKITGKILDASNGTEDGIIEFAHIKDGSQTITGRWKSTELQLLNGTNLSVNDDLDVDGHTELDDLNVSGVSTFTDNAIFDNTNSIQIPVGTEAQKDAVGVAVTGQIRFNTTNAEFEGFGVGNNWGSLGGVKDVDGDTFITAEASAGNDDDTLNFHTADSIRATIDSTGQVGIGSTIPAATLDVLGNTKLTGILTVTNGIDGIGIQSEGTSIVTGIITTLNFVGNGVSNITNTNGLVKINFNGGTFTRSTTSFTATAGQTSFSLTYTPNFIDVYHNGVRLTSSEFTATNGSAVVLTEGAFVGDTIDIVVFQNSALFDTSKWSLVDTGNQSGDIFKDANVGIGTAKPTDAAHASNTKILNVGVVTANNLYGEFIGDVTGNVTGTADLASGLTGTPNITVGIITASTISVAGTITYDDVTNVDSIGIITARSGIHIDESIVHIGDTNTKIGFPAVDTFAVETSGNERLRVTSTGKLEVYKGTSTTGKTSGSEAFTVGNGASNHRFAVYPDGTTVIGGTGDIGNNNILLQNDGKVGIKTTAPNNTLTIGDGVQTSYAPSTAGNYLEIARTSGADAGLLINKNTGQWLVGIDNSDGANSPLRFEYGAAGSAHPGFGAGTLGMIIKHDGKIGIGTDNPNTKLQIVTTSGARALTLTAPTLGPYMAFETDGTAFADIGSEAGLTGSGSNTEMLTLNARGSRSLSFRTNSTERLRITSGGSIGIGTDNPAAKVDLEGVLGLESTITTISSTSVTTIDTLPIATYRSAKFQIQVTQGTSYQTADLLVIHDGSISSSIEYASLSTGEELAVFTTTISGSNLLLQATMSNASSATVKVVRYGVTI